MNRDDQTLLTVASIALPMLLARSSSSSQLPPIPLPDVDVAGAPRRRYDVTRGRRRVIGQSLVTTDDVVTMQQNVLTRCDQLSAQVEACAQNVAASDFLSWEAGAFYTGWLAESAKCHAYAAQDVSFLDAGTAYQQGLDLMAELNTWEKNIASQPECKGVAPPPAPPPPPVNPPSGPLGGLLSGIEGLVVLGVLAFLLMQGRK